MTQPLAGHRSLLRRFWDLLLGREAAVPATPDRSVSFAELVWAHAERQKEVLDGIRDGEWEQEYRRRLGVFQAEYGKIIDSYWCRYEASGAAITEKVGRRRPKRLYRRDLILSLHTATDWRTADTTAVALCLHQWETLGLKVTEVLRDTSERIALSWVFNGITRLLATIDREGTPAELDHVLEQQQRDQEDVRKYYVRAADNSARLVYFRGMVYGTVLLTLGLSVALLIGWWLDWLDPRAESTYTLFVVLTMGAAGAILSVMTRMAKENGFNVDFEVGRKSVRFLGGIRPWIGAAFALALYLALKSSLIEFVQNQAHGVYFYATVGFLAGFSERRAKVLLDSVGGGGPEPGEQAEGKRQTATP
jgi:hypothetical protein